MICEECGSPLIEEIDTGEIVCPRCGTVVRNRRVVISLPENYDFPRNGLPLTFRAPGKGINSIIGWKDKDGKGNKLNREQKEIVRRLRKWEKYTSSSIDRSIRVGLGKLNAMGEKLNLPNSVIETAAVIYTKVTLNRSFMLGRKREDILAGCIYAACRQCNVIYSLDNIAIGLNLTRKEVARAYRKIYDEFNIDVPPVDIPKFISKCVSNLHGLGSTERLALKILEVAGNCNAVVGKSPKGLVGACIYIASKFTEDQFTQPQVADVAGMCSVTLRNRYKDLLAHMDFITEV